MNKTNKKEKDFQYYMQLPYAIITNYFSRYILILSKIEVDFVIITKLALNYMVKKNILHIYQVNLIRM